MTTAIHDRHGTTVGWLDGDIIRDSSGQHQAFIRDGNISTYSAKHIGTFRNGYFRDRSGHAIGFVRGASGGPLTPLPALPPLPPLFPLAPIPPIPPIPPVSPVPSLSWSNMDWEEFLGEEH